jgi:hypothetical protein
MSDTFVIKYDGRDADDHTIDMRQLGESLQGIDRLISDLLIIGSQKRLPKKGERAPLVIKAHEPKQGTVSIPVTIQEAAVYLQLGWQVFGPAGKEILSNWFKGVLCFNLGKKPEAEKAMETVAQLAHAAIDLQSKVEDNRHKEISKMLDVLKQQLPKTGPAMIQTIAPVGKSVSKLSLLSDQREPVEISSDDAEQLRKKAELEWTSIATWSLKTDGFVFHNRTLSVEHPHKGGFFNANVADPIAENENNPYAAAVQRKAQVRVQARAAYRADELEQLVIYEFGEEAPDA